MKKVLLCAVVFLGLLTGQAVATDTLPPIKIGGIFSYSALPDSVKTAQNAAKMAVAEWNEKGGLNGRKAEIIIRDDRGNPASAVQVGEDLIQRDHVVALTGTSFTNASLAIATLVDQEKIPYVPVWCWKDTCIMRGSAA